MASFQVTKAEVGFIVVPKSVWKQRGWKKKTQLAMTEGMDGSLIFREVRKQ
jgi:hypothetical protein